MGTSSVWVRRASGAARTVSVTNDRLKVQVKSNGAIAYLLGINLPNLFVLNLRQYSVALRFFSANTLDFMLSPDEANVVVGLDNNTAIVSDTTFFFDVTPISLGGRARAIVISPDSSPAYTAVGNSSTTIVTIRLEPRRVIQRFPLRGAVEALSIPPSGRNLYAVISRTPRSGNVARFLRFVDTRTRRTIASRTLQPPGTQSPTFDIEAGATSIFVSSSQPLIVGLRRAGVVRFGVRGGVVGRAQAFAQLNAGTGAIAFSDSSRTLVIIQLGQRGVRCAQAPRK